MEDFKKATIAGSTIAWQYICLNEFCYDITFIPPQYAFSFLPVVICCFHGA